MCSKAIDEAVILAGGMGTRLDPLTRSRPKPLVPVGNLSMLDWNFSVLASNGIKRVIIVVGYLGDQIRNHIARFTSKTYPIDIVIPKVNSKGTADAVRVVSDQIESENFFVTMSDIVTNINLMNMASFHLKKHGLATISLKHIVMFPKQFGVILVDEGSKITRFLEKPKSGDELYYTKMVIQRRQNFNQGNLINSGVYCFNKEIVDILEHSDNLLDFGNDVFPYLLEKKFGLFGYKSDTDYYWQDCGCPDQLLWTNLEILQQWNWPYFPKGNQLNGSWYGNKSNYRNVLINNPVAIGNNVKIKSGTRIHLSSINDQCQIGKNCDIIGSTIWENVKIGDNVRISNSIISNNVIIGDNTIIEDESVIPAGKTINSNSFIRRNKEIQCE